MEPITPTRTVTTVNLLQDADGSLGLSYLNISSDCESPLVSNDSPSTLAKFRASSHHDDRLDEENASPAASTSKMTSPSKSLSKSISSCSPLKSRSVNLRSSPTSPFLKYTTGSNNNSNNSNNTTPPLPQNPTTTSTSSSSRRSPTAPRPTSQDFAALARASLDFLNPTTSALESLTSYNVDAKSTEDFEKMETIANTPNSKIKISPDSPFAAYLSTGGKPPSKFDNSPPPTSDSSLATLSPSSGVTPSKTSALFKSPSPTAPFTPVVPDTYSKYMCTPSSSISKPASKKLTPSSSKNLTPSSATSSDKSSEGSNNWMDIMWSPVQDVGVASKVSKRPKHRRKVSWDEKVRGEGVVEGESTVKDIHHATTSSSSSSSLRSSVESTPSEDSPFADYSTPLVKRRMEKIEKEDRKEQPKASPELHLQAPPDLNAKFDKKMKVPKASSVEGKPTTTSAPTNDTTAAPTATTTSQPPAPAPSNNINPNPRRKEKSFGPMITTNKNGGATNLAPSSTTGTALSAPSITTPTTSTAGLPIAAPTHSPPPPPTSSTQLDSEMEAKLLSLFPASLLATVPQFANVARKALASDPTKGWTSLDRYEPKTEEVECKGVDGHGEVVTLTEVEVGKIVEVKHSSPPSRKPEPTPQKSKHASPPSRKPEPTPEKSHQASSESKHSSPPSRKPLPTPEKSNHSSPPSRKPLPTPDKSTYARLDSKHSSPPSRKPQPTPSKTLTTPPAAATTLPPSSTRLKYVNNTWTLTPSKSPPTTSIFKPLVFQKYTSSTSNVTTTFPIKNESPKDCSLKLNFKGEGFTITPETLLIKSRDKSDVTVVWDGGLGGILEIEGEGGKVQVQLKGEVVEEARILVDRNFIRLEEGKPEMVRVRNGGEGRVTVFTEVGGDGFEVLSPKEKVVIEGGEESGVWVMCKKGGEREGVLAMSVWGEGGEEEGEVVHYVGPRIYDVELKKDSEDDFMVAEEEGGEAEAEHTTFSGEEKVDGLREKLQRFAGLDVSDIWNDDEDDDEVPVAEVVIKQATQGDLATPQTARKNNDPNDTDLTYEPSASLLTPFVPKSKSKSKTNSDSTRDELKAKDRLETSVSTTGSRSKGRVYFRRSVVEFGEKVVGTCGSMRLQLCNSTSESVVVRVAEPSTPFVVLHKKVRIKPQAFVRLPVRFVPMNAGFFETQLHVDVGGGRDQLAVLLRGQGK
ncbi:hypothetical protein TrVE_jg8313 [Triparma verrucosa]|uniref:Cep192-like domain-containing protein n=1 Tax=Triparma verrucosa TaxID=1606542 RepID=A0A9W7CBM9_9STRA|nr:hypothetical protein TrVE_jg8313 [Triparma verrucosa]